MSVTGMCDVCEARTAEHSCPQCGANVCEKHFDREFELCMTCAPTGGASPPGSRPDVTDDDVDTFQF